LLDDCLRSVAIPSGNNVLSASWQRRTQKAYRDRHKYPEPLHLRISFILTIESISFLARPLTHCCFALCGGAPKMAPSTECAGLFTRYLRTAHQRSMQERSG